MVDAMSSPEVHDLTGMGRDLANPPPGHARMRERTERLLANFPEGVEGGVVILMNEKGEWSCSWECGMSGIMGPTLFAALVKEIIEVELTADRRIRDLVREG